MAKQRFINTRFWDDGYISNLDPIEKLLFLYFLTNPATNICGIYELPLKRIALDTGIDKEMVDKVIRRFTKDEKIYYIDGWVIVKNFIKHQSLNPNVRIGIENGFNTIPDNIWLKIADIESLYIAFESLSIELPILKLKLKLKPKLEVVASTEATAKTPNKINLLLKEFETVNPIINYGNKNQRKALDEMLKKFGYDKLLNTIRFAVSVQGKQYAPVITTPCQLRENMGKLLVYYQKENTNKSKFTSI